jgi:hypothetical protein
LEYIFLLLTMIIAGVAAVTLYRFGLRDGQRMASGRPVIKEADGEIAEVTDKVKRMQTLFDNLDAYDGTDKGQVKV